MNLEYKAKDIKEIENTKNVSIEEVISNPTISNLELLLMKGLNKPRKEIEDEIDGYIKEIGRDELLVKIVEAMVDGGFLGKPLLATMKEYLKKANEITTKF